MSPLLEPPESFLAGPLMDYDVNHRFKFMATTCNSRSETKLADIWRKLRGYGTTRGWNKATFLETFSNILNGESTKSSSP